jgi:hypothetical protein
LKDHKGNIIVWIVIILKIYFPLIEKFTCSNLDTQKKNLKKFKAIKPREWTILVFSNIFFYTKCAPFLLKIGEILTLMIRMAK